MQSLSETTRGALLMMASMACFAVNDAFMKSLGGTLPVFQALAIRGALVVGLLLALVWMTDRSSVRLTGQQRFLTWVRMLSEVGAAYLIVTALYNMDLANITAILQVLPLSVTLAAWLLLGEPLGWRRLVAIGIGFLGVLLIIRPGTDGFTVYSLYGLGAVLCVTVRDLTARRLGRGISAARMSLYAATAVLVFSGTASLFVPWAPLTVPAIGALGGSAVAILFGYILSVAVMQQGAIGSTAPFRYTGLLWALLLGLFVFGEWPDALTLLGALIVVGTGIFTLSREARLKAAAGPGLRP